MTNGFGSHLYSSHTFAGTGTTGEAALREGFRAVLIEREPAYRADIARRMRHAFDGESGRKVARAKAKGAAAPGGLFGDEGGRAPRRPRHRPGRIEAMKPRPTIAKGDHVEVTRGPHRGATGEAFAIFPRVRDPRVMVQDDKGRILSVPMDAARKIGARK